MTAANRYERRLFVGGTTWDTRPVTREAVAEVIARSQGIPEVKTHDWRVEYAAFARAGFTQGAWHVAQQFGVRLIDLPQLERDLVESAHYRTKIEAREEIEF